LRSGYFVALHRHVVGQAEMIEMKEMATRERRRLSGERRDLSRH